jgi:RNA polymerase sigma-70 factor (ECF subfamily)
MKSSTDYSKVDDPTLMRLIARSQEEALAQLYDRYNRLVFSLAFAIVRDRATAEEITLDVFMRVWQKAATYQPDRAKVSTWLTHITRNHAIDILRRWSSRPEQQAVAWEEEIGPGYDSAGRSPAESAEDLLQREHIRTSLKTLPPEQRQVLLMAYFEGYTQTQIAETLRQPLGTIKTRMRLAMQKLRALLGSESEQVDTSVDAPSAYNISKKE